MSDPLFLKRVIARREKAAQSLRAIIERFKLSQQVPVLSAFSSLFENIPVETAARFVQDASFLSPDLRLFNVHWLEHTVDRIKDQLKLITDSVDDVVSVYLGVAALLALAEKQRDPNTPPAIEPPKPEDYETLEGASRRFTMLAQRMARTDPYQEYVSEYLQQLVYTEHRLFDTPPATNQPPTTGIFASTSFIDPDTENPPLVQTPLEPEPASKTPPTP